jgi:hypothetical protein
MMRTLCQPYSTVAQAVGTLNRNWKNPDWNMSGWWFMETGNPEPSRQQIRRVRHRSTLALAVLVGLWLIICAFVLLAIWFRWEL